MLDSIEAVVKERNIEAGCVLSGVGSLTHATLRLANREFYSEYDGHFEIVSHHWDNFHPWFPSTYLNFRWSWQDHRRASRFWVQDIYDSRDRFAIFEDVVYKREFANDSGYEELVI